MEIQQLRYFVTLSKVQNFTHAAERCGVAQPSLSQQIQKLEQELGIPLFHRQGRKTLLTQYGEMLLPRANKILSEHHNALQEAIEHKDNGEHVSFGSILSIAPYLVPKIAQEAHKQKIPIEVEENFTEKLLEQIKAGTIDFGIMSAPIHETSLMVQTIAKEPFVAIMHADHPLTDKKQLHLNEILEYSFLELSHIHCAGEQQKEICKLGKNLSRPVFKSAQIETIKQLILQAQGVTILPRMTIGSEPDTRLACRPIKSPIVERDITIVHHPDRYLGKNTHRIINSIKRIIKSYHK